MARLRFVNANAFFWGFSTVIVTLGTLAASAAAGGREPLVGPHPWDFPERNRQTSFAYQYARDNASGTNLGAAAGIAGALGSTVIINSNAYAVGNWQQIEMTLGDGAEGLIMTENHQDNSGNATADSRVLNDTEFSMESGDEESSAADGSHQRDRNGSCGHGGESCWGTPE